MSISSNAASSHCTPLASGEHNTIEDEESSCGLQGHKGPYDTDHERVASYNVPLGNETNGSRESLTSQQLHLDNHVDDDDGNVDLNQPPAEQMYTPSSPSRGRAFPKWRPGQGTWTALLGAALIIQTLWYNAVSQNYGEQGVNEARKGTNLTREGLDLARIGLVLSLQANYWAKEAEMREQYTECPESDMLNHTSRCERIVSKRVEAYRLDVQPNFELPTHTVTVTISSTPTATNITTPEVTQAPNPTGTNGLAIFYQCLVITSVILPMLLYYCGTGWRRYLRFRKGAL